MAILQHIDTISKSRLEPYKRLCRNSYIKQSTFALCKRAICIYTALQHRSSIFFSLIQEIEICVRNEMTRIMRQDLANNNDLLDYFCSLALENTTKLSTYSQKELKYCLMRLINDTLPANNRITYFRDKAYAYQRLVQQNISENDIIANLTFGFWVNLIDSDRSRNPHYLHWNNVFYQKIFNSRFNTISQLFNDLRDVRDFRNRLSHQDAIWSKSARNPSEVLNSMKKTYSRFDLILSKLSPYRHNFRYVSVFLYWQESLNFDIDIFNAEINKMMQESLILPQ